MSNKTMLGDASGRGAVDGFRVTCPAMQHPYTEAEIDAVVKVMREACGQTQGKYMVEFEQAFCAFTGAKHADGAQEASGKLEVTIGADAKGNLFAVYVGSVPNTTNNALYLSAYDPATNTWGDGVMLAMRNMDTYEASLRYDWGSLTAQAAYLGLAGEGGGLLTDADVRSLYGEDADNVLANLKAYPDDLGDKNNLTFSNVQAVQGAAGELLVLTQGTLAELGVVSYTNGAETAYMVMPEYADGGMSIAFLDKRNKRK